MNRKSMTIQVIIVLIVFLLISGILLSFSERKYQILDIQSDRKGDAIFIEQICYYLSALLLMIAWGYIFMRHKKGFVVALGLTIITIITFLWRKQSF